jgi:hypothetical protein
MPIAAAGRLLDTVARGYRDGVEHYAALGHALATALGLAECTAVAPLLAQEPWVFAHAVARLPAVGAQQLAYGFLPDPERTAQLHVQANAAGVVVLPGLGYLAGASAGETFEIDRNGAYRDWRRPDRRPMRFSPLTFACDALDLAWSAPPAVEALWPSLRTSDTAPVGMLSALAKAFDILSEMLPDYAALIVQVTRRILMFDDETTHSFATHAAFGAAFVKIPAEGSESVFLEEIAHQCGHILFSALTHAPDAWLATDAADAPRDEALEGRSLYTKLHGIFTEAMMLATFDACLTADVFAGRQRHELLGRTALIFRRMHYDLVSVADPALYTLRGQALFEQIYAIFVDVRTRRLDALTGFDFSGQPYSFDPAAFLVLNPA